MRKVAKTAEADYLHALVRFQYGEEGLSLLPDAEQFSLVPLEIRKKLEYKKKEEAKHKSNEDARLQKDLAAKARDFYSSGPNKYRSAYRHRFNPYSGSGSGQNWDLSYGSQFSAVPSQFPATPQFSAGPSQFSAGPSQFSTVPYQVPAPFQQYAFAANPGQVPTYSVPTAAGSQPFKPRSFSYPPSPQALLIEEKKKTSRCGRCHQWGHWHNDGLCDPADVAHKLAQFKLQDPQMFAAAKASALQLEHAPPPVPRGT